MVVVVGIPAGMSGLWLSGVRALGQQLSWDDSGEHLGLISLTDDVGVIATCGTIFCHQSFSKPHVICCRFDRINQIAHGRRACHVVISVMWLRTLGSVLCRIGYSPKANNLGCVLQ